MQRNDSLSRRRLMKGMFYLVNTALAALIAVPVVGFLVGPLLRRSEGQWVEVGPVEELAAPAPVRKRLRYVSSAGYREQTAAANVWVRSEGSGAQEFTVFSAECTHVGCSVMWDSDADQFRCPCHGGVFAPDGAVLEGPPPRPLDRLPSRIEAGRLYVQV